MVSDPLSRSLNTCLLLIVLLLTAVFFLQGHSHWSQIKVILDYSSQKNIHNFFKTIQFHVLWTLLLIYQTHKHQRNLNRFRNQPWNWPGWSGFWGSDRTWDCWSLDLTTGCSGCWQNFLPPTCLQDLLFLLYSKCLPIIRLLCWTFNFSRTS